MRNCAIVIKTGREREREWVRETISAIPDLQCLDMQANAFDAFHYFSSRRASQDPKSFSMAVEMTSLQSHVSWLATHRFWLGLLLSMVRHASDHIRFVSFPDDLEAFMKNIIWAFDAFSPSLVPFESSGHWSSCCVCIFCFETRRVWREVRVPSSPRVVLSSMHRVGDLHWKTC